MMWTWICVVPDQFQFQIRSASEVGFQAGCSMKRFSNSALNSAQPFRIWSYSPSQNLVIRLWMCTNHLSSFRTWDRPAWERPAFRVEDVVSDLDLQLSNSSPHHLIMNLLDPPWVSLISLLSVSSWRLEEATSACISSRHICPAFRNIQPVSDSFAIAL